jgi:hypothetical protein
VAIRRAKGRPNIDTGGGLKVQGFNVQVSTLASRLILGVQLQAEIGKIAPCGIAVVAIRQKQLPDDARLYLADGVLSEHKCEFAVRYFQRVYEKVWGASLNPAK